MTINEAQQQVDQWIKTIGVKYFGELTNMAILTEEVGELSKHMARIYGEQSYKNGKVYTEEEQKQMLGDEMADVLWVVLCLANQTGINLTEALNKNFDKKTIRDAERHANNTKLK
ncbi:nucleotide pyrophosphohydrolase [Niabella hibiscisoli]|uniref:nucleotide pyrophosphohydrolase n=1 Tax=Niabella hibiscisoli TaxID=1825928 RepID=UPI001F0EB7AC|nr:nucleotide pyrophosphohydrolase [Niabella hibiscisoli]MCH5717342.1 nucleotide pyrophosphohydrolase [Niabella hibiscisoli]